MRISHGKSVVRQPQGEEGPQDVARARDQKPEPAARRCAPGDRIEISTEGRSLQAQSAGSGDGEAAAVWHASDGGSGAASAAVGVDSPLDAARLTVIRDRIESGYYETKSVTEVVTDRLLELLGLKQADTEA